MGKGKFFFSSVMSREGEMERRKEGKRYKLGKEQTNIGKGKGKGKGRPRSRSHTLHPPFRMQIYDTMPCHAMPCHKQHPYTIHPTTSNDNTTSPIETIQIQPTPPTNIHTHTHTQTFNTERWMHIEKHNKKHNMCQMIVLLLPNLIHVM